MHFKMTGASSTSIQTYRLAQCETVEQLAEIAEERRDKLRVYNAFIFGFLSTWQYTGTRA